MTTIIIIALLAILVLWIIAVQRKLVSLDEMCKNSLSQIGVQQSSRWDALTALAELVKSYNEHEYNTLKDIIAQRKQTNGVSSFEDIESQEKAIASAVRRINVVAEQYPELKASESYARIMDSVNTYENQVRTSRMVYNDSVTKYNRTIRQIPDSFVAAALHFNERKYLEVEQEKTGMPSMKF